MYKVKTFFLLLTIFILFGSIYSDVLPDNSLRLLQDSQSNNSVVVNNNKTTNNQNTADSSKIAKPDSSKKWNSSVLISDRQNYEKMLTLKKAFTMSLWFLPTSFHPENPNYLQKVSTISIIFAIFGGIVLVFLLIFLILRFGCKKCVGPIKTSQVTRAYRNITWLVMITSLISLVIVYVFLLTYSTKIEYSINDSIDNVLNSTNNIQNVHLGAITNLTVNIRNNTKYIIDNTNYINLVNGIISFNNVTTTNVNAVGSWERRRAYITLLIFLGYLIIIALSFLGFFKHWQNFLLVLSLVLLFSLPGLLYFEGIQSSYYFVNSDLCQDIHSAIYENQFPVSGRGIGNFVNCFNTKTKSSFYSYKFQLDSITVDINSKISNNTLSSSDLKTYTNIKSEIKDVIDNNLTPLIGCNHVYQNVQYIEQRFCVNGMTWSNYLISCYSWLFLVIFVTSIAINRMKPLVEKKKSELESMLINEDALY